MTHADLLACFRSEQMTAAELLAHMAADAPVTGYITIRDGGGTLRKLAVIA